MEIGVTLPAHPLQAIPISREPEESSVSSLSCSSLSDFEATGLGHSPTDRPQSAPSDDRAVELQDHSIIHQAPKCEFDIEVLEVAGKSMEPLWKVNTGRDGIGLVEWGEGEAEYKPRPGADFFHTGRVISSYSGRDDELDQRTLIVLTVTNNGYSQCLALCQHTDHTGEERAGFYNAHAAVYSSGAPLFNSYGKETNDAIELIFRDPIFKMRDSCYVNFEHTWTLSPNFPVLDLGYVRKDQRRKLLETHLKVQTKLSNRNIAEHGLGERLKAPRV